MSDQNYILEIENITKSFETLVANDSINLKIKRGEIHAILGENGAGKSTLMNILAGLYSPDEGTIYIDGKEAPIKNPKDSINLGIGMIHQHFRLVDRLTVTENIVMGYKDQGFLINKAALNQSLLDISNQYYLPIRPDALVRDLSAGEKQRVEIVKMLFRKVKILILDEPTSVLTPQEAEDLFKNLRRMKQQGETVIFISHKLEEVMNIADRVTVLRNGKMVAQKDKEETNPKELARLMIGREMQTIEKKANEGLESDRIVLRLENVSSPATENEIQLKNISLSISGGEILGIAGVSGNGQSELAQVLTGMRACSTGKIFIDGREMEKGSTLDFIEAGVSHIPEDRIGVGTIGDFSCIENVILKRHRKPPVRKGLFIDYEKAREVGDQLLVDYDVRMLSSAGPIKLLSGGNMQKLILARELSSDPKLIIAMHPTHGLDVSAIEKVYTFLLEQQKKGSSVLLISEDLDEIISLSDTIAVMFQGSVSPKRQREEWTIDEIGFAMMGVKSTEAVVEQ